MDAKSAEDKVNELIYSKRKNSDSNLLITLHKILIGDKPDKWYCLTCPSKMDAVYWDLKLKYYQSKKDKEMAKHKGNYRFSKEAKRNGVTEIVILHRGKLETVTEDNLTDSRAEAILENDAFKHNIEAVEPKAEAQAQADEEPVKASRRGRPSKEEGQIFDVKNQSEQPEGKVIEGSEPEEK